MKSYQPQFSKERNFPDYPSRPRVYLIASTPRSGSHYFGHLLNSTNAFGDPLEYFHKDHQSEWQRILGTDSLGDTLDSLYRIRTSENGVFGAKAHYNQLLQFGTPDEVMKLLNPYKILFITRLNKALQAVSMSIAFQTGSWISSDASTSEPNYDFKHIKFCLERIISQEMMWMELFKRYDRPVKTVVYEEAKKSPDTMLAQTSSFLEVVIPEDKRVYANVPIVKQSGQRNIDWAERFSFELSDSTQVRGKFRPLLRKLRGGASNY